MSIRELIAALSGMNLALGAILGFVVPCIFAFIIVICDSMDPSPSDILYSKIEEYKYRRSLYTTAKKKLTIKQIVAIIIEILIIGGLFIVAQNTDLLDVISIVCTVAGVTCFQLYDFIMNHAKTCSVNFRYQIEHHKVCKFKYAEGYDKGVIVRDALIALMPFTYGLIGLSIIPTFYAVDNWIIAIILLLYVACVVKSLYYLCIAHSSTKVTVFFIVQVISLLVFFCMTWCFPSLVAIEPSFVQTYTKMSCFLLILAGLSYLALFMYLNCFWCKKVPVIVYLGTYKEKGNYFEIETTDGEDPISSKDKFFYPVEYRDGVLLLFEDGTSLIIGNDKIKRINSYGVCNRCI